MCIHKHNNRILNFFSYSRNSTIKCSLWERLLTAQTLGKADGKSLFLNSCIFHRNSSIAFLLFCESASYHRCKSTTAQSQHSVPTNSQELSVHHLSMDKPVLYSWVSWGSEEFDNLTKPKQLANVCLSQSSLYHASMWTACWYSGCSSFVFT